LILYVRGELNRCVFVLSNECDRKKVVVHHESRAVTTAAAAVSSINVNGKKIDGSEEKTNILFTRMFFFLVYVVPSIPSSTNSHDMNIQRLTLNRSNGHSLSLYLPLPLSFDELFIRQNVELNRVK
jgi:hypothetical protein